MSAGHVSTAQLFRLVLWVHWRTAVARMQGLRRQSRLMIFVLAGFVASYLSLGYYLFHAGLSYLYNFPVVGALLSQRILFLIFGFFFAMLVFSNLIVGYTTLFKNRETAWFLTLPISHRDVYRWKFVESTVVSSWALVFLSTPMMVAFGRVQHVEPFFYIAVLLIFIPFVVIPAVAGSWLILILVRVLALRWVKWAAVGLAVGAVAFILFAVKPTTDTDAVTTSEIVAFDKLLRHSRVGTNPYLPSAWVAQSILNWSAGLPRQGGFYFLVLLSNAMMGLLLASEVGGRFFYTSWSAAYTRRAERAQLREQAMARATVRTSLLDMFISRLFFLSRPMRALVLKDIRIFWRDPAQWTQFMIFFGLLFIYVLNLRNVSYDLKSPFWSTIISHLNLGASSLTLSTLTTRFVFPQFSLEGRRLWIIGLAPIGIGKVLLQKFWLSCIAATTTTVTLMVVSSVMLRLDWSEVLYFAGAVGFMSAGLSGLAVGTGTLFPNLKEDNPSKIVSGFGGTLCLVMSFVYIAVIIGLLSVPATLRVTRHAVEPGRLMLIQYGSLALAVLLSIAVAIAPMWLALRKVRRME